MASVWLRLCVSISLLAGGTVANANSLSIGPFDQGVYSGTPPFSVTGICTNPGDDCNDVDDRVRTTDLIQYAWSIAATGIPVGSPDFASVVFEQTVHPGIGAQLQIDSIPTICLAPPQGPGGSNPISTLTENADNSVTLSCNLGRMGNGEQRSFTVPVRAKASSVNEATFTSTQFVYALDAAGNKIVPNTGYVDPAEYEISAAPAFDLIADRRNLYKSYVSENDLEEGAGPEAGYVLYFSAHVAADQTMAGKGIEALGNSMTFNPVFTATQSDGLSAIDALPHKILSCEPNTSDWGSAVYGNASLRETLSVENTVVDSGSCAISGDYKTGYTMTLKNVDSTGSRYPTETIDGSSLAAGPYFVAAYRLAVWVPLSAIYDADGIPGNHAGSVNVTNCLFNFDPNSRTGTSNYGAMFEPGYNGSAMPDGSASNNCTGPVSLHISASGRYSHSVVETATDNGDSGYGTLVSSFNSGDGRVEPAMTWAAFVDFRNTGSVPLNNTEACVMFDNTTAKLADASVLGASGGRFAFVADRSKGEFDHAEWKIEYGTANYAGDNPLDRDNDGLADFNPVTGRYEGQWSNMRASRCDDAGIVNWASDPAHIGIDNVNMVRVSAVSSAGTALMPSANMRVFVPFEMRSVFNGGPHAGTLIPTGTVVASMSTVQSDELWTNWRDVSYTPSPESSHGDGDRVSFTRITVDVAKSTHTPSASPGVTESVLAGNDVVWQLTPVVSSQLVSGGVAENLSVTDILPAGVSFDAVCTQGLPEGVEPDLIEHGQPNAGETRLTWFLGNVHSSDSVTPLVFCTGTDPLSAAGTVKVNKAFAKADNATVAPLALQGIALGQSGAIQASVAVDAVLQSPNEPQVHTLSWFNFSQTGTVAVPTVINVLPFNGDGFGASARSPQSRFSGSYTLVAEPVLSFADGSLPKATEPDIGRLLYSADTASGISHNPNINNSTWCDYKNNAFTNALSAGVCPGSFADVTAIKFVANYNLETDGHPRQGVRMTYSVNVFGNAPENVYTNTFGIDSPSLPDGQYIKAQRESVVIDASSTSDVIPLNVDSDADGLTDVVELGGTKQSKPKDTDHDGTPDYLDTDSDNDGIPDRIEAGIQTLKPRDSDADGTPDYLDLDSDADGTPDAVEAGINRANPLDSDNDGIADYLDQDSDNDGVPDTVEAPRSGLDANNDGIDNDYDVTITGGVDSNNDGVDDIRIALDTDGDGLADYLDLDSDNDGFYDIVEAGYTDENRDGVVDGFIDESGDGLHDGLPEPVIANALDTDGDGVPDAVDVDADNDGIPTVLESADDRDKDGVPDYLDLDSDNDGIPDRVEAGLSGIDSDGDGIDDALDINLTGGADVNADGISDALLAVGLPDTDGDATADVHDLDSDNDGIADVLEYGGNDVDKNGEVDAFEDSNGDGFDDATAKKSSLPPDSDGDGQYDALDYDSDNDGIPDFFEGKDDTDGDAIPDRLDTDADNDGIPDAMEASAAASDTDGDGIDDRYDVDQNSGNDHNRDGIDDFVAVRGVLDSDGDGVPDYRDLESDNDGIADAVEAGPVPAIPADSDNDGVADYLDTDSDGDGINDAIEVGGVADWPVDTDSDGLVDYLDFDSDNDGIADSQEGPTDTDGDGLPDYLDTDADNDGLTDSLETAADADADGISNFIDTDSDNDGLPDQLESGGDLLAAVDTDADGLADYLDTDSDNDGVPDYIERHVDSDGDGVVDALDPDSDNDGIADAVEAGPNPGTPIDTDADGVPNRLDNDSDSDGIPDSHEFGLNSLLPVDTDGDKTPDFLDGDSDADGIPDVIEFGALGLLAVDTDGDGTPDFQDTDADGDGIGDIIEAGPLPATPRDSDGDGVPDVLDLDSDADGLPDANETEQDTDGDGVPNFIDQDSDSDGIGDNSEGVIDSDSDGIPDYIDYDTDNDGIPDAVESGNTEYHHDTDSDGTPDFADTDADGDGIPDAIEAGSAPSIPLDSDYDGVPNYLDLDSDNDGVPDSLERVSDTDKDGVADYRDLDSDGDGLFDITESLIEDADDNGLVDAFTDNNGDGQNDALTIAAVQQPDTDSDSLVNRLDIDSDNDGIPDTFESAGTQTIDTDGDGVPDHLDPDADGDGIPDKTESNIDSDNDGIPDYRDRDADNDGIADSVEGVQDTDSDGTPDYLELDADNDGMPDSFEGIHDTDADGVPDYKDPDSDGDGIEDVVEGVIDSDNDGIADYLDTDSDNDGINDAVEGIADSDADGIPDFQDTDSDNDGLGDKIEANTDSDNDGIPDNIDALGLPQPSPVAEFESNALPDVSVDSDYDGIPDLIEGIIDSDNDGVQDSFDLDSDNDGIPDTLEGTLDTDADGVVDRLDRDSDNDGILDAIEAQVNNSNLLDSDGDGVANHLDLDSDNDGLSDTAETQGIGVDNDSNGVVDAFRDENADGVDDSVELFPVIPDDLDADGIADYLDRDSDNDGIMDLLEAGGIDANGDGVVDSMLDSDEDGIADSVDVDQTFGNDADADGIDDSADVDFLLNAMDSDGDGIADSADADPDGDGFVNIHNDVGKLAWPDSNNNGVPDVKEPFFVTQVNAGEGEILSGVSGKGCAVYATTGKRDPTMPAMLLVSLLFLARRRQWIPV